MKTKSKIPVFQVGMFTTLRVVFNSAIRMVYPFIPFFSRGINVDITAITLAISLSMATSALGPFLAPVADRYGRRTGMLLGISIFTVGNALAAIFPSYWTFLIALLLSNLGDNVFLPATQAYLSDRTPYNRRGFVLGITELSWALSFILAIPLIGLLIKATYWYAPFAVLAVLGALSIGLVLWKVNRDQHQSAEEQHIYAGLRKLFTVRNAVFLLLAGLAMIIANEVVNVVFSVWMEDSFQVQIAALGAASLVIGLSELSGEGLTAAFVDKVGKERSVFIGLIANCLVVAVLPILSRTQTGALIWLFLFYLTFEYAVTASWPITSEVMPGARATMLAAFIASLSMGRAIGALIGPWIYHWGFLADAIVCVVFNIICMLLMTQVKVNPGESHPSATDI
jgi:predicted MFS family arabinose efflux permease